MLRLPPLTITSRIRIELEDGEVLLGDAIYGPYICTQDNASQFEASMPMKITNSTSMLREDIQQWETDGGYTSIKFGRD